LYATIYYMDKLSQYLYSVSLNGVVTIGCDKPVHVAAPFKFTK